MRYNVCVDGPQDFYNIYTPENGETIRTRGNAPLVFEEHELTFNPWEHIIEIPRNERRGPFELSHCVERSSYYEFIRDGIQYSVHFSNVRRESCG